MMDVTPRCPFCATVVTVQNTFWSRLGLKAARAVCSNCQRASEARDAQMMGASFYHWAELFRGKLAQGLETIPILTEPQMNRALGDPNKEDTRVYSSLDELARTCMRHQRVALIEMACGREALLEVVPLRNETSGAVEVLAILGTSCSESGAKEREQLVARTGMSHFVLYTYPGKDGAESRVRRAVHARPEHTAVQTNAKIVAALRSKQQSRTAPRPPGASISHA